MSKSTQIKWRILDMQIELKDPTMEKRLREHYEKLVVIYGELEQIYKDSEKSGTTEGKEVSVAPGQISANLRRK